MRDSLHLVNYAKIPYCHWQSSLNFKGSRYNFTL